MNKVAVAGAGVLLLAGALVVAAIVTHGHSGRPRIVIPAASAAPPPLPSPQAVVLAQQDGGNGLALAALPGRIRMTLFDGRGFGVEHAHVTVGGTTASTCGRGCYEARTNVRGRIAVAVDGRLHVFVVPRTAPDATALIAHATRAFRALRSVTYVERLASSTRNHIVSTFTLEAPNRVEYRIRGGTAGIVIGLRRWDRSGGRWVPSSSVYLPQPSPIWGTPITNAHVISRTGNEVTVSFLNPKVPAWFLVHFDASELRPRSLDMIATAHFMHHVYRAFNAPRRIFPPS